MADREGTKVPGSWLSHSHALVEWSRLHIGLGHSHRHDQSAYLATVIESASDAVITISPSGVVISWNRAAEGLYGYSSEEIVGQPFLTIVPDNERLLFYEILERALGGKMFRCPQQRLAKNGSLLWVEGTASPVIVNGRVVAVSSIARDVTAERELHEQIKQALAERDAAEAARRELAARLLYAEEEERQRIAAELHDDTIQVLASTALMLDAVRMSLGTDGKIGEQFDTAIATLRECLARTRHLMFELHPAVLEHQGLDPAVLEVVNTAVTNMPSKPKANVKVTTGRFDPISEALIFRIVREAVVNIKKHSAATTVNVDIYRNDGRVLGRIEDNGKGFDMNKLVQDRRGVHKHLGLSSLAERVQLVGGQTNIRTSPGTGVSLAFWIPLPEDTTVLAEVG